MAGQPRRNSCLPNIASLEVVRIFGRIEVMPADPGKTKGYHANPSSSCIWY